MMNLHVVLRKINEGKAFVDTEDFDFLCDMRDHFSFFADGYKFHPAYRNKSWDGKIRLLHVDGTIPLGLHNEVKAFCERHGKTIYVDPDIGTLNLDRGVFDGFVESLNVHSGGEKIDPYYYQKDASHTALEEQRCLLLSPTSSGKSLIQYILLRMYQRIYPDAKILIIVPNVGLVTQMQGDFKDYSSETDWNVEDYVTGITKGKATDPDKGVIITTYQSLSNAKTKPSPDYFEQFEVIMVDEVHTATAKSIQGIMDASVNARTRIGLTGTLSECKTNEMVLRGMFGKVINVITTRELMDQGKVATLQIKIGVIKYLEETCKWMRSAMRGKVDSNDKPIKTKCEYPDEMSYILQNMDRNKFIMRLCASLEGNSILMINSVEHGLNLYDWMTDAYPDRDIYLYNGSVGKDDREEIRNIMETKENAIIIGSLGTISTGISIKRLHNLIFAHPSKARIKVLQTIGRLLRKSKFGNDVVMYDIVDDFSIGAYENYTLDHGRDRVRFYHSEQHDVETINVDIFNK